MGEQVKQVTRVNHKDYVYHYTTLDATGSNFDYMRTLYLKWLLGVESARKRDQQSKGVPQSLMLSDLEGQTSYSYESPRCRIEMRQNEGTWLLLFDHEDTREPGRRWVTQVRLRGTLESKLYLEHGTWQSCGEGVDPSLTANTPRILRTVMDDPDCVEYEQAIYKKPLRIPQRDVKDFITHEFFKENRWPIVVVSAFRQRGKHRYRLDPNRLWERLRSQVTVIELPDEAATRAWSDVLGQFTHEQYARCFDGAIRLYMPVKKDAYPKGDNRWTRTGHLWLAHQIKGNNNKTYEYVAGHISRRCALQRMPIEFMTCTERFDRASLHAKSKDILEHISEDSSREETQFEELKAHIEKLEASLDELQTKHDQLGEELKQKVQYGIYAEDENETLEAELNEVKIQANNEKYKADALQKALDEMTQKQAPDEVMQDRLMACFTNRCTSLEGGLRVLATFFPDRVVVLEEAYNSARESHNFLHPGRAFDLMCKLVWEYLNTLREGGGDSQAREIFGKEVYAANESETVRTNKKAVKERTFMYQGRELTLFKHLRIGTGEGTTNGWRLHFEYDSPTDRVVIGHCGKHLTHKTR